MIFQIKAGDEVVYDGNGNVIEINGVSVAKGPKVAGKTKTLVRDRIMEAIKDAVSESDFYSTDIKEEPSFFLRSPSNDYTIEITGKKDRNDKRAVVIAAGGAVSEYAAGLLRTSLTAMKSIPDCEVLWAEGSKIRVSFASGDYEVRVVKKRNRIK